MQNYFFTVYEVDSSYYFDDAQSLVLSKNTLTITDGVDDDLHRTQAEDPQNDQTFSFNGEPAVVNYTVQYLDFAQVNGAGPEFELYAMEVAFSGGAAKYYVMSKDPDFNPSVGDDVSVTTFSTFSSTEYGQIGAAVCYAAGTLIATPSGSVPVENLRPGDLVQTRDNGCKEVLWIGQRRLHREELDRHENLRPVLIGCGIFGNPEPLLVSPQHRILLTRADFPGLTPWDEAFVKAKHLAELARGNIRVAHGKRSVTYVHVLLDRHEVVFANGLQSESFYPGEMALRGISRRDRTVVTRLFPVEGCGESGLARPAIPRHLVAQCLTGSPIGLDVGRTGARRSQLPCIA